MMRKINLLWITVLVITVFSSSFGGGKAFAIDITQEQLKGVLYPLYDDSGCTGVTCACSGPILAGGSVEEQVWNFLVKDMGLTAIQAAGAMGNIQRESANFNVTAVNPSSGAYGLIQWYAGRKTALQQYAASQKKDVSDLGIQLAYMKIELEGAYKDDVLTPLKAATTLEQATRVWLEHYEIPCLPGSSECAGEMGSTGHRLEYAQNWLTQFGSGTTASTPGSGNGCAIAANGCPTEPVARDQVVDVRGILVHPCIAEEVERILELAESQNLQMDGGGWRSSQGQIDLRTAHGCGGSLLYNKSCKGTPQTAVPGTSLHESGTAIDFRCDGSSISSRSHPCFIFLRDNTSLINLEEEPWHWSESGN